MAGSGPGEEQLPGDRAFPPWEAEAVTRWIQLVLDSFRHWTGRELIERTGGADAQAHRLFAAPFVVVSHGTEPDPILNYGNRRALELWEADWHQFTKTPSRLTAEPVNRAERERLLAQASARGFIEDYSGIRITVTGRRFIVEQALVWTVIDGEGNPRGQAATFPKWVFV